MCGIAGYCGPAGRFSDQKLREMLRAIEHRGPDDCGVFSAPLPGNDEMRVWLGSRRLAIQDLTPAGHQPMIDQATGNAIAFNGEIYNFLELRARLEEKGCPFRSRCDTEVALRSWCAQGLAAVEQWRGMFGAALWDQGRQELWLLRDHWGIKPLYYHRDGEGLAFCSEVRGLLAGGVVPRQLSRRGLEDYLRYGAPQDPVTIIDGVYALLPGHALKWSKGKLEIRRYSESLSQMPSGRRTIESMLREIVRQQLISDVPVVVFLSGGVDSSVVSLLARQEAGAGVNTMSVVFEESHYSERYYARRVAERIGTRHHEVLLKGAEARQKAIEAISRMDQPSIDGINTYVVCEAARRGGFTVALSGLGGDEFFGPQGGVAEPGCEECDTAEAAAQTVELAYFLCFGIPHLKGFYSLKSERRHLCARHARRACLWANLYTGVLGSWFLLAPITIGKIVQNIQNVRKAHGRNWRFVLLALAFGLVPPLLGLILAYFLLTRGFIK